MDYQALFNELHLFEQLLALLVGMPRLFMLVQVAPFMGGNILTGQLRTTVVFACYLILHPAIVASLPETQGLSPSTFALYGAILVKETLIGMLPAVCTNKDACFPSVICGNKSTKASSFTDTIYNFASLETACKSVVYSASTFSAKVRADSMVRLYTCTMRKPLR